MDRVDCIFLKSLNPSCCLVFDHQLEIRDNTQNEKHKKEEVREITVLLIQVMKFNKEQEKPRSQSGAQNDELSIGSNTPTRSSVG
ncbi:hypothetical protein EUGRSUZ_F03785 [Eucalyptus grandis]|uniref:Uncharacterized protein n=2 Tax=Eucalyptus grandis TaxID=71139 RepID=A0ACC3KN58_EUCGR|nr:hypothetical protein EUGRSUZ_F03785 [Eucalyptus grandis]